MISIGLQCKFIWISLEQWDHPGHYFSLSRNEPVQLDHRSLLNMHYWKNETNLSFAICDDFIRTNKNVLIGKYCTQINPVVLLLFGTAQDSLKLNEYEMTLSEKPLSQLRTKINACLKRKLQSLGGDSNTNTDYHCINLLVKMFTQISQEWRKLVVSNALW